MSNTCIVNCLRDTCTKFKHHQCLIVYKNKDINYPETIFVIL